MSKERKDFEAWRDRIIPNAGGAIHEIAFAAWQAAAAHYQPLLAEKDAEIARLQNEAEFGKRALQFLDMQGYRKCSIAACNCPYWHGGNASERLFEIHDLLSDAGFMPHRKTALVLIFELIAERNTLKALLEQAREGLSEVWPRYQELFVLSGLGEATDSVIAEKIEAVLAAINAATGKGE